MMLSQSLVDGQIVQHGFVLPPATRLESNNARDDPVHADAAPRSTDNDRQPDGQQPEPTPTAGPTESHSQASSSGQLRGLEAEVAMHGVRSLAASNLLRGLDESASMGRPDDDHVLSRSMGHTRALTIPDGELVVGSHPGFEQGRVVVAFATCGGGLGCMSSGAHLAPLVARLAVNSLLQLPLEGVDPALVAIGRDALGAQVVDEWGDSWSDLPDTLRREGEGLSQEDEEERIETNAKRDEAKQKQAASQAFFF